MSHYRHLSIEEREKRSLIKGEGRSLRRIAQEIGRASATLSREATVQSVKSAALLREEAPSLRAKAYSVRAREAGAHPQAVSGGTLAS